MPIDEHRIAALARVIFEREFKPECGYEWPDGLAVTAPPQLFPIIPPDLRLQCAKMAEAYLKADAEFCHMFGARVELVGPSMELDTMYGRPAGS